MNDLQKAEALLEGRCRVHPSDPAYRKPVMVGSTACLTERRQFPEYEAWVAKREEKQT